MPPTLIDIKQYARKQWGKTPHLHAKAGQVV
jgi:hypothetical protein